MKKVFFKTMMGAGVAGMLMAGCVESVKDLYDPNYVIEQYQKNWEEQFGEIDPDHTWNMAKQVVADINLYGIADDECEVKIYTANPISSECSLLAKGLVQGNKVVSFDVPSPLQYVFVTATNSRGALVNGYYKIEEGVVTIGKSVTRAEETRVGNIGLTYSKEFSYWDPNASRSVSGEVQFAHLSNVEITTGETWMINDFVDVVGNNGVFSEYGAGVNGKVQSNLDKWKDVLGTEVIYKLTSNGPLNLSYNFGATQNDYLFGYFYYEDNENPNDAVRYVLLSSTDPCNYLKINGGAMPSNMYLGNIENLSVDTKVTGSKISLTYFDSNNNASYIFPENLNVGFFIAKKDSEGKVDWNHMKHSSNEISCNPYNFSTPKFVTYNVGSTTFLGVEDGTDDDMNDLLFFVSSISFVSSDSSPICFIFLIATLFPLYSLIFSKLFENVASGLSTV